MTTKEIRGQSKKHFAFYILFGLVSTVLMMYYLSNTIIHFTTPHQFPVNSFARFPLTMLIFPAEFFSFLFGLYFVYVLLTDRNRPLPKGVLDGKERTPVAVLVPVYNEPREVVDRTLNACSNIEWEGGVNVYLLDDSNKEEHIKDMKYLASKYRCRLVRRDNNKGYKAGNINNAVSNVVREDFFAIFDSDQAPRPEFLQDTMDYFSDPRVSFTQTPQYFVNKNSVLERTVSAGSNIFFQAMCVGRARDKTMVFCGTNAVIRTSAFREVGGFSYYTSTEDIELGLRMNEAGYHGAYVPKVLAEGYAPQDFKAYSSQQYRWSNGNLAILRESWLKILASNLTLRQKIHTLFAVGWWLIGIVTLIYITVPLLSVFLGLGTHHTWMSNFLLAWLYFNVVLGVGIIYVSLRDRVKGEPITLKESLLHYILLTNSLLIYARAAVNALFKRYVGFVRTSKKKDSAGIGYVKWNLLLGLGCLASSMYALFMGVRAVDIEQVRTYIPLSLWLLFYSLILSSSIIFTGSRASLEDPFPVKSEAAQLQRGVKA